MKKHILFLGMIAASLVVGCSEAPSEPLRTGDAAPAFTLTEFSTGEKVDSESLQGNVVLLNFWSTTCANCLEEIEELKAIHSEGNIGVVGIAINDNDGSVKKLVATKEIDYPVLNGNEAIFLRYDGYSTPYSVLIDSNMKIRKKINGRLNREELQMLVESL